MTPSISVIHQYFSFYLNFDRLKNDTVTMLFEVLSSWPNTYHLFYYTEDYSSCFSNLSWISATTVFVFGISYLSLSVCPPINDLWNPPLSLCVHIWDVSESIRDQVSRWKVTRFQILSNLSKFSCWVGSSVFINHDGIVRMPWHYQSWPK